MEIMISEDFENELSVTYDGAECRIESCDVESIGETLREITILLRKVEEESEPEELSEGMMRKLQAERSASGPDQPNDRLTHAAREYLATFEEEVSPGQDQQAAVPGNRRFATCQWCGEPTDSCPAGPPSGSTFGGNR